jgi:hypothetical protein
MRLISHNLLRCNIKGLSPEQGYPLIIEADRIEIEKSEFNAGADMTALGLVNLMSKLFG